MLLSIFGILKVCSCPLHSYSTTTGMTDSLPLISGITAKNMVINLGTIWCYNQEPNDDSVRVLDT